MTALFELWGPTGSIALESDAGEVDDAAEPELAATGMASDIVAGTVAAALLLITVGMLFALVRSRRRLPQA